MVAPSPASAGRFLSAPPAAIRAFLFYGSDSQQIAARAATLARSLAAKLGPEAEILRLHDADLAAEPSRVSVELATGSLFGGTKIVWLTALPAKQQMLVAEAVSSGIANAYLVVQASDLKRSHKIVQTFEAAANLAAIACYGEDRESLIAAIRQHATSQGFEVAGDAAALIAARSDDSALIARSETEKLMTYAGPAKRIGIEDVEVCLLDQQTAELSEISDRALGGDAVRALHAFERYMAAEQNVTPVLVVLSAALLRLHALRIAADSGVPAAQAIKDFKPPIFFKQHDAIAAQVRRWPAKVLTDQIARLNETVKETRLRPALAEDLTINLLLAVAKQAQSKSGK